MEQGQGLAVGRAAVLGPAQYGVADDEAVVGGPGVDAEAALLTPSGNEGPGVELELETEAPRHLVAPLETDRSGRDDQHEVHPLSEQQLLEHKSGCDGLAQADVVGNEEVRPGQLEGLLQSRALVVHELDARAERGLEEPRIGRGHGVPLQGVEVGAEEARLVELFHFSESVGLGL